MQTPTNKIEIRKMQTEEIDAVVELWYAASVVAHSFISADYWDSNRQSMKEQYLPMSETYLAVQGSEIVGFVALLDDYLAAIFVSPKIQGQGIGTQLLDHVKLLRQKLQLKVYTKNANSVGFYKAKGFVIMSEEMDENTGKSEFLMEWEG